VQCEINEAGVAGFGLVRLYAEAVPTIVHFVAVIESVQEQKQGALLSI